MSQKTKDLILDTASLLFAESGFSGVSIRNIADSAGVNVSSVSYHFGGKEALFQEILLRCSLKFDEALEEICKSSKSFEDLATKFFDYSVAESDMVRNVIRLLLTKEEISADFFEKNFSKENTVPPSIAHIVKYLTQKHGKACTPKKAFWMARTLHYSIMHHCLVVSFTGFKKITELNPSQHSIKEYRKSIAKLAKSISLEI